MGAIKRQEVFIDTGYRAREQFMEMHQRTQRWGAIVAHRRAGKTVACANDLIDAVLRCPLPNPRFAYIAPFYAQAKDIAWMYFKEYGLTIPGVVPHEGELRLDFPGGGRIKLYGADNYDRMRGIYLDGCILDEPADMPPSAFPEVIRPALSDRRGWALYIGTSKGRNSFYDVCKYAEDHPDEWYFMRLKASESGILPEEELADARKSMSQEQYDQEYECSFDAALVGAYYAREVTMAYATGRVRRVEFEPDLPVHAAWDLGISDSMAIWYWQAAHDGLRVLGCIEDHGQKLGYYTEWMDELSKERGYKWGIDYVPHDARVRDLGTGKSRLETLMELGREPVLVPNLRLEDGINAVRQVFSSMWFDELGAGPHLEAIKQYRAEFDEKKQVFNNKPRHDWTSHKADAFRMMAIAYQRLIVKEKPTVEKIAQGQVTLPGAPTPSTKTRIRL